MIKSLKNNQYKLCLSPSFLRRVLFSSKKYSVSVTIFLVLEILITQNVKITIVVSAIILLIAIAYCSYRCINYISAIEVDEDVFKAEIRKKISQKHIVSVQINHVRVEVHDRSTRMVNNHIMEIYDQDDNLIFSQPEVGEWTEKLFEEVAKVTERAKTRMF